MESVEDGFLVVMRTYFEKPRTNIGWDTTERLIKYAYMSLSRNAVFFGNNPSNTK